MHLFVALLWALSLGEASGALLAQPAAEWRLLADLLPAEKPEPSYDVAPLRTPTLCDPSVKQYSGYLDISLGKKYFFWLMESRSAPKTDPVVMWLTGGPGCSSQLALLAENGPCSIDAKSGNTTRNPYSWTSNATVMWVDQPAGTGFSTGIFTPDTNENEVANDMYRFLQQFYKALPQYKSNPFFIFGESYAGHYVPAVAHRVWLGGKNAEGFAVPLRGIGIGNGLVDPQEQYKWYPAMAKDGGRSEGGTLEHGVITSPVEIGLMKAATVPCVAAIALCNAGGPNATKACVGAYVLCNYGELIPYQLTGMNPYDMREKCENGPLCYDFSAVDKYLNSPSVQEQLGVHKQWFSCNRIINALFQGDWMKNFQTQLPDLLQAGIPVLIYAGDVDYICNWLGNKKWTLAMQWPHKAEYNEAPDQPWVMEGKTVGRLRSAKGLNFLQVYQAGHMVPRDQPKVALHMLNSFIEGALKKE